MNTHRGVPCTSIKAALAHALCRVSHCQHLGAQHRAHVCPHSSSTPSASSRGARRAWSTFLFLPSAEELQPCSRIEKKQCLDLRHRANSQKSHSRGSSLCLQTSHEIAQGALQESDSRIALISLQYFIFLTHCFLYSEALNPQALSLMAAHGSVESSDGPALVVAQSSMPSSAAGLLHGTDGCEQLLCGDKHQSALFWYKSLCRHRHLRAFLHSAVFPG